MVYVDGPLFLECCLFVLVCLVPGLLCDVEDVLHGVAEVWRCVHGVCDVEESV